MFVLEPSMPRNLEVNFLSSSSLHVNWKKPFFPNGDITHYVVRYHEIESSHLWNIKINWCTAIDSSNLYGTKAEEKPEEGELYIREWIWRAGAFTQCLTKVGNRTYNLWEKLYYYHLPSLNSVLALWNLNMTLISGVYIVHAALGLWVYKLVAISHWRI